MISLASLVSLISLILLISLISLLYFASLIFLVFLIPKYRIQRNLHFFCDSVVDKIDPRDANASKTLLGSNYCCSYTKVIFSLFLGLCLYENQQTMGQILLPTYICVLYSTHTMQPPSLYYNIVRFIT